jgi:hypothetical protein
MSSLNNDLIEDCLCKGSKYMQLGASDLWHPIVLQAGTVNFCYPSNME